MIVIGDVHGCYETLMALVAKLPEDKIIFAGDLIDRGPNSKKVVQWVMDNSDRCQCVTGNHEQMLLNAVENKDRRGVAQMWLQNGGVETLDSYFPLSVSRTVYGDLDDDVSSEVGTEREKRNRLDIPKEHLDFFRGLPLYIDGDDFFVSHSCWNPCMDWGMALNLNDREGRSTGLTWYRGVPGKLPNGKFHIFGHTPVPSPEITDYSADIDTGAFHVSGKEIGYGRLTALQFPSMKLFHQENIDKMGHQF